jgi:cell division protease FtsH
LKGKRPVREDPSEETPPPRSSAVPTTGGKPRPDKGEPGLEPQPQA